MVVEVFFQLRTSLTLPQTFSSDAVSDYGVGENVAAGIVTDN